MKVSILSLVSPKVMQEIAFRVVNGSRVNGCAQNYLRSYDKADLVSEVILSIYEKPVNVEADTKSAEGFLFKVCQNRAFNFLNKYNNNNKKTESLDAEISNGSGSGSGSDTFTLADVIAHPEPEASSFDERRSELAKLAEALMIRAIDSAQGGKEWQAFTGRKDRFGLVPAGVGERERKTWRKRLVAASPELAAYAVEA